MASVQEITNLILKLEESQRAELARATATQLGREHKMELAKNLANSVDPQARLIITKSILGAMSTGICPTCGK